MNTFFELADARAGEGRGLPRYVKNAFLIYLECGILAHGFARVRCPNCGYDTVVAYSCQERGLCPSCPPTRRRKPPLRRGLAEARSAKAGAARHMSETAAFLVDRVLPQAPVRQWVLSLPIPVRYILARDAKLLGKALGIVGATFRSRPSVFRGRKPAPTPEARRGPEDAGGVLRGGDGGAAFRRRGPGSAPRSDNSPTATTATAAPRRQRQRQRPCHRKRRMAPR